MINLKMTESEIKKVLKSNLIFAIYFFYIILMILIYRNTSKDGNLGTVFSPYASGLLLY